MTAFGPRKARHLGEGRDTKVWHCGRRSDGAAYLLLPPQALAVLTAMPNTSS
jgi:hypothetical protein